MTFEDEQSTVQYSTFCVKMTVQADGSEDVSTP